MEDTERWIERVVLFDTNTTTIYEADGPMPQGYKREAIIVDKSGSMGAVANQAATALAELIKGTNAENKIPPIHMGGGTGMVACVDAIKDRLVGCRVYLIGDGAENRYSGSLTMSDGGVVTLEDRNCDTNAYQQAVADWLVNTCGIQFIMVALGTDMERLISYLLNRDTVFVCNIPRGAPSNHVIGTVRAITARANRVRTARAAGQPAPQPQREALMPVSEEAEEMIRNVPDAEVQQVAAVASNVRFVPTGTTAQQAPPPTAEEVKAMFHTAEDKPLQEIPLNADEVKFARAVVLSYMHFCREINDGGGLPSTFISGLKAHSRVALYEAEFKFGHYFNKLLAALARTKAVNTAGKVPEGGLKLESNGIKFSFAKQTTMYTTDVPKDVIAALQADGEFALPESQLKKRAAATGSPGRVVRQRTDAGSPTASAAAAVAAAPSEAAAAPAAAAAAMEEEEEAASA